ncbi:MAG: carboxypeptidase-like regulatory domain-containing protein, partial [Phycisphaerales bacterium]|nr:carboxypeptidase-like regulatory domain-containing protein [Phycisphaerales bacterium]
MRNLLIPLVLALAFPLWSQTTIHASLGGHVTDPAGAAVEDAALTLTSIETGTGFDTRTGSDGAYLFPRLTPGKYSLSVQKAGFEKLNREGINISIGAAAIADLRLRVGDLATQITVTGDAEFAQTQSSNVSLLIDEARIKDLPLNS